MQTAVDLAKETAEASTELQKQLQKVLKTVTDFATKYAKENKEAIPIAIGIVDTFKFEETANIYEQQNKLIAEAKKSKSRH
ncbi:MAG: hypothetical protein IPK61_12470 [Saprospiraceae bacterium]|nr:hypothetical protein [Saprospiraceae bacterium]